MSKTLKLVAFSFAGFYAGVIIVYLLFSFVHYDLNPVTWGEGGRAGALVGVYFMGTIFSLLGYHVGDMVIEEQNKQIHE